MIIPNLSETLDYLALNQKRRSVTKGTLLSSDQFETLIPGSNIYFLGIRARVLPQLANGNSSIGKKTSWFTIFEGRILK